MPFVIKVEFHDHIIENFSVNIISKLCLLDMDCSQLA